MTKPAWTLYAPHTWRLPVPGGWIYAAGDSIGMHPSAMRVFVPNQRATTAELIGLPDAAVGALPDAEDAACIIATELRDGIGRLIWSRGSHADLVALRRAIIDHAVDGEGLRMVEPHGALQRDFAAWTQGEPTGADTTDGTP
jgi:hypothetical protein